MSKFLPIGVRLREERERLGLKQADFAAIGGSTRKTQFNYETGERAPDGGFLALIAAAGADVQYILTGQRAQPTAIQPASATTFTRDEQTLPTHFRALTDREDQRAALKVVGSLAAAAKPKAKPQQEALETASGGPLPPPPQQK